MIDTWTKDGYRFTCEVEYWPSDGSKARAYWNYGTDKKFGGPGKSGYFIEIKMFPQNYWLSKKIHGWIRQVRPFKGPFGPGIIDQFWQTGKYGRIFWNFSWPVNSSILPPIFLLLSSIL